MPKGRNPERRFGIYDVYNNEQLVAEGNINDVARYLGIGVHTVEHNVCLNILSRNRYKIVKLEGGRAKHGRGVRKTK